MNIDFYNEIRCNLKYFYLIIKKKKLKEADIEQLLIIIDNIKELLDTYLYDYFDY